MDSMIPTAFSYDPLREKMSAKEVKRGEVREEARRVSKMNQEAGVDQRIFAMEECTEVTIELMKYAQDLSKGLRGHNDEGLINEICDIFASSYILLLRRGVTEEYILNRMLYKYQRALERHEKTGEI